MTDTDRENPETLTELLAECERNGYRDLNEPEDVREIVKALAARDWRVRAEALRDAAKWLDTLAPIRPAGTWLEGACDAINQLHQRADREEEQSRNG